MIEAVRVIAYDQTSDEIVKITSEMFNYGDYGYATVNNNGKKAFVVEINGNDKYCDEEWMNYIHNVSSYIEDGQLELFQDNGESLLFEKKAMIN